MGPWSPTSLLGGHLLLGITTGIPLAVLRPSGFWQLALALARRSGFYGFWQLALATGLINRHYKVFWGTTQHSHCLWPINVWTHSSLPSFSGSYNLEVTIWMFVTLESHNRKVTVYKSSSGSVVMCWKSSASSGRVWIWESLVSSGRVWIWESSVSSGRFWIHRCHHLN